MRRDRPCRCPDTAFNPVKERPAFRSILDHAELVIMPKLGCMAELERRRLSFFETNPTALGPMNAFRVRHWRKEMDEAFAAVRDWLP